ncbi:MAG: hypothetical protein LBB84_04310 [Tannerellaceae bacterium]|jgi:hypothetical protein|nr:hypothetical protein [Tannerellaceae bacterium]
MKYKRLLSGSFWLIMSIHLAVFTAIGLFSARGWGLLATFLSIFAVSAALMGLLFLYAKRHPEKKRLAGFVSKIYGAFLSTRR